MSKFISKLPERLRNSLEKILSLLGKVFSIICLIVVVVVSVLTIASCVAYFQLANNHVSNTLFFKVLNIGGFLSTESITAKVINENIDSFKSSIEYATNISVAISGLLLTAITAYSYFSKVSNFRKQSSFKRFRVYKTGEDDIKVMKKYFTDADKILIFSSTFSWAVKYDIKEELERAANSKNKLWLYSDDFTTAQANLSGDENLKNRLKSTGASPIHFSFVKRDSAKYILYRQEDNEKTNVILFRDKEESKGLFEVIDALVNQLTKQGPQS